MNGPLLATVWLCWGLSYPFMFWALETVDILTARLLASLGAGGLLLGVAVARHGAGWVPDRADWPGTALASLFNMVLFPLSLMGGVMLVGPGQSAILTYTMPLWAALLAVPVLGERPDRRTLLALGLGLGAVALVLAGNASRVEPTALGVGLGIAGGAFFAAGTVVSKKVAWRSPMLLVTAWQLLLGTLPAALLWLALHDQTYFRPGSLRGVAGTLYMVLFANALAYLAWFPLVGRLPASVATLSLLVVPCIGVASSALLAQRPIGVLDLAALLLVLGSTLLVLRRPAARPLAGTAR